MPIKRVCRIFVVQEGQGYYRPTVLCRSRMVATIRLVFLYKDDNLCANYQPDFLQRIRLAFFAPHAEILIVTVPLSCFIINSSIRVIEYYMSATLRTRLIKLSLDGVTTSAFNGFNFLHFIMQRTVRRLHTYCMRYLAF